MTRYWAASLIALAISGCATVPAPVESVSTPAPIEQPAMPAAVIPPDLPATIYVFRHETLARNALFTLAINDRIIGRSSGQTYYRLHVRPGPYRISSIGADVADLHIDAAAGNDYYVWQEIKFGWLFPGTKLHLVDPEFGSTAVSSTRIAEHNSAAVTELHWMREPQCTPGASLSLR